MLKDQKRPADSPAKRPKDPPSPGKIWLRIILDGVVLIEMIILWILNAR